MKRAFIIFALICFWSCGSSEENKILIATAANMQAPIQELVIEFEKTHNITCELSIASSGKLAAQIQQGAPFDIFISADTIYPNLLFRNQLTSSRPEIYGYGNLCLCTMDSTQEISFTHDYLSGIEKLAIANPAVAPYGLAAVEALKKVYPTFKENVIYGESIGQTALFLKSGAIESGVLAKSMQRSIQSVGGKCVDINKKFYTAIAQAVTTIKRSKHPKASLEFQNFLLSQQGKEVLNKFGYSQ